MRICTNDLPLINVKEYRRGNHKWTIQRNWQHWVHKTKNNIRKPQHKSICVGHHYTQTNTNNVNKTWSLLQPTRGKAYFLNIIHRCFGIDLMATLLLNLLCGVLVSVFAWNVIDRGFHRQSCNQRLYICICRFSTTDAAEEDISRTDWIGVRIMCPSRATCLSWDCYFIDLSLLKICVLLRSPRLRTIRHLSSWGNADSKQLRRWFQLV